MITSIKTAIVDPKDMKCLERRESQVKMAMERLYWNSVWNPDIADIRTGYNYRRKSFLYINEASLWEGRLKERLLSGGPVFRGGILTFEWFYEIGTPLNKAGWEDGNWGDPYSDT